MFHPEGCIVCIVLYRTIGRHRTTGRYVLCGDCRPYLPEDDERVDDYEDDDNDADDVHRQNNPNGHNRSLFNSLLVCRIS